jgi:hypothetical protein
MIYDIRGKASKVKDKGYKLQVNSKVRKKSRRVSKREEEEKEELLAN